MASKASRKKRLKINLSFIGANIEGQLKLTFDICANMIVLDYPAPELSGFIKVSIQILLDGINNRLSQFIRYLPRLVNWIGFPAFAADESFDDHFFCHVHHLKTMYVRADCPDTPIFLLQAAVRLLAGALTTHSDDSFLRDSHNINTNIALGDLRPSRFTA